MDKSLTRLTEKRELKTGNKRRHYRWYHRNIKHHNRLGRKAFLWKKSCDQTGQHIKKQRHYFADSGPSSLSCGFSSSHVWMWELDHKESWTLKNWCFWTVVLEKTLESPLDCREIKPVNPKWHQFSSVQSLSRVRLFATPWTAVRQASLFITNSGNLLKLMSIE